MQCLKKLNHICVQNLQCSTTKCCDYQSWDTNEIYVFLIYTWLKFTHKWKLWMINNRKKIICTLSQISGVDDRRLNICYFLSHLLVTTLTAIGLKWISFVCWPFNGCPYDMWFSHSKPIRYIEFRRNHRN